MASLAELKERAKARTAANKAAPTTPPVEKAPLPVQPEKVRASSKAETSRPARKAEIPHPSGDPRFKLVDRTLQRFQYQQDALIEVLHTAQEAFGFLENDLLIYVARQLRLPLSWVYGVATFYHFFTLKPQGEHTCVVCLGTACYVYLNTVFYLFTSRTQLGKMASEGGWTGEFGMRLRPVVGGVDGRTDIALRRNSRQDVHEHAPAIVASTLLGRVRGQPAALVSSSSDYSSESFSESSSESSSDSSPSSLSTKEVSKAP